MIARFTITQEMVDAFVRFTSDRNAQHTDEQVARRMRFRRRVVHGMLPFSHLLLIGREFPGKQIDLKETETRFLKPAFTGDEIELSVSMNGDAFEATWTNAVNGDVLTKSKGTLGITSAKAHAADDGDSMVSVVLEENVLGVGELEGKRESIPFQVSAALARRYEQMIGAPEGSAGPSMMATLLLSTMIGMRIPGRYATFMSFAVTFEQPVEFGQVHQLIAVVEKVMAATESLNLSLSFERDGATIGGGKMGALVSPPPRPMITCQEIRERHLDLGLRNKVALVTGSSRGIGATTAKLLAMHGCKVIVNYFHGKADAEEIAGDIRAAGGIAMAIGCDVADEQQVQQMFAQIEAQLGGLDLLVNNAVRDAQPKELERLDWEDYLGELNVTLKGMVLCCRETLPIFRRRGRGKIVNLSTIYVDNPVKGQSKYITAKSAVVGYSRALAREVAGENIQVNVLSPNMTQTDLLA
ncbi:MAG: SDR family NAD(P)-dependent oxidoreductase, partial [Gemmatimonadaceae bacterium]|nr:SDR family NAD(P)-dependent oxidoreductase [Gemmatimonadaceae bacterium]